MGRSIHYDDVIMSAIASQITSLSIVYSTVYLGADQSKHQSSASLAFVWGIHRGPVNSPHKWPVTRKMFPFDDVIMHILYHGTPMPCILLSIPDIFAINIELYICPVRSTFMCTTSVLISPIRNLSIYVSRMFAVSWLPHFA